MGNQKPGKRQEEGVKKRDEERLANPNLEGHESSKQDLT